MSRSHFLRLQPHPPVATGGTTRSRRDYGRRPQPLRTRAPVPPTPATPCDCNRRNYTKPEETRPTPTTTHTPAPHPPTPTTPSRCNRRNYTKPEGTRPTATTPHTQAPHPPTPTTPSRCNRRNHTKSEGIRQTPQLPPTSAAPSYPATSATSATDSLTGRLVCNRQIACSV
jgi:hypothetical protein